MKRNEARIRLDQIDQGSKHKTVIDPDWFDYIKNTKTLEALLVFTKLHTYSSILKEYEGLTIDELIETVSKKYIKINEIGSIEVILSESELQDLQAGKEFNWRFPTKENPEKYVNITIIQGEYNIN
jgi:hypothetical protein